ncbi:WecB/TagA/CpsF family glycosyltransferase [Pseudomonas sp. NY15435]|uniref:WecB/TagA/CpsF family glycosyltransferase n=1 Tax=Pseudomonas sp. NY15435 TaxID=3400358 RepID=UPI003A85B37C
MNTPLKTPDSPKKLTTFINPFSYYIIRNSPKASEIYDNFKIHYDGISLSIISKLFSLKDSERISFDDTSLAPTVFKTISKDNLSLGIIGSSTKTILTVKDIIEKKYNIKINSINDGYYSNADMPTILSNFKSCDVVITSMGTPLQETFLLKLKDTGWNGVGFTCGGYFDQLASKNGSSYYPCLVNKLQIRWLYRLYKEPRRLWRRYLIQYPIGLMYFLYDRVMRHPPFNIE